MISFHFAWRHTEGEILGEAGPSTMFENGLGRAYNISFQILLYVFGCFACMVVCVLRVCRVCGEQKRVGSLRIGVKDGYELLCGCW